MPLLSDLRGAGGGHYLYDLLTPPGFVVAAGEGNTATVAASDATVFTGTAGSASGAGDTAEATAAEAYGYRFVTIAEPIHYGPGSIFYPSRFDGTPEAGHVVRYPARDGFVILEDGTIIADEYGEWDCYYDDGGGEQEFTVELNENADVYAAGATATASASTADLYGGVNIEGDAPDVVATPATGTGTAGNIATGAGAQATASAAAATVAAGAEATGDGVEVEATAAEGVGEVLVHAEGAGVEVSAEAAEATASGDVFGTGAGVTVVASAAAGTAVGDRRPGSIPYLALTVVYPRNILIARAAA